MTLVTCNPAAEGRESSVAAMCKLKLRMHGRKNQSSSWVRLDFTKMAQSKTRNIFPSLMTIVLISGAAFAQSDVEKEVTKAEAEVATAEKAMARAKKGLDTWNKAQVAIVCARATQDAKDNEVTAEIEAECQGPSFGDNRDVYITKRCLDKAKEKSDIANRTRDAICVAETPKEANAIGLEGFGKVAGIAREEADFAQYNLAIANKELEKHNANIAKERQEVGGMAGLFGAAFFLFRWKKKRRAA